MPEMVFPEGISRWPLPKTCFIGLNMRWLATSIERQTIEGIQKRIHCMPKRRRSPIAKWMNGKYLMYWGVGSLRMTTTDNLIHWESVQNENRKDIEVLKLRRSEKFRSIDNLAVEGETIALLTEDGIVVMYNGIYNLLPKEKGVPTEEGARFGNCW